MELVDITVIIPVYNGEKYIRRAVNSVLKQDNMPRKIVIVNDGSTDNTGNICEKLKQENEIIEVVNKVNGGLSSARNCGLDFVETKYVSFLDADDEYLPNFIGEMLEVIEKHDSDIVVCGYYSKYPDGNMDKSKTVENICQLDRKEAERQLLIGDYLSSHAWNKVYKTVLFDSVRYPEGKNYEDVYVLPSLLDAVKRISFLSEHLVIYYQLENSITHVKSIKNECDAFEAAYIRYKKYKDIHADIEHFAIREPLEIAIRLVIRKRNKEDDRIIYSSVEEELENLLLYVKKNKKLRKKIELKLKYKIVLICYSILRGKI